MTDTHRRVGIRAVAELAGVSVTTVSLVLNDRGRVGPQARARVRSAAAQLGYRPDPNAARMRARRSGVVGVVERVPPDDAGRWDHLEIVARLTRAVCAAAWDEGWYPALLPGHRPGARWDAVPLDGTVLVDPLADDPQLRALEASHIPAVTMGAGASWCVDTDWTEQGRTALDVLCEAGARRPLVLSASTGQSSMSSGVRAFRDSACLRGLDVRVHDVPPAVRPADCRRLVRAACLGPEPVDALYIVPEALVQPALDAVLDAGLSIPGQLQIITASDGSCSRSARVPVTSFDLQPELLGRSLVSLLRRRMDGLPGPTTHTVPARLLVRESTGSARM